MGTGLSGTVYVSGVTSQRAHDIVYAGGVFNTAEWRDGKRCCQMGRDPLVCTMALGPGGHVVVTDMAFGPDGTLYVGDSDTAGTAAALTMSRNGTGRLGLAAGAGV